jgi:outer membrane protein
MKRLIGILSLGIILIIAGQYTGAQNLKFGYINKDELYRAMPDYDSATVKIENFRKQLVSQLESMQAELDNKTSAFDKESRNYSDIVRKTKEQELKDLNIRIQLFQVKASQQVNNKNAELIQPLLAKAEKAIRDVGKEQGFTLVFDASLLYYFDEKKTTDILVLVKTKLGLK